MKAVVAAFNQEKALVGAFSVITNLRMELFEALERSPAFQGQYSVIRVNIRSRAMQCRKGLVYCLSFHLTTCKTQQNHGQAGQRGLHFWGLLRNQITGLYSLAGHIAECPLLGLPRPHGVGGRVKISCVLVTPWWQ